jgi:hypothetical protein
MKIQHGIAVCCCCCGCGHVGNALALSKRSGMSTVVSLTLRPTVAHRHRHALWWPLRLWVRAQARIAGAYRGLPCLRFRPPSCPSVTRAVAAITDASRSLRDGPEPSPAFSRRMAIDSRHRPFLCEVRPGLKKRRSTEQRNCRRGPVEGGLVGFSTHGK